MSKLRSQARFRRRVAAYAGAVALGFTAFSAVLPFTSRFYLLLAAFAGVLRILPVYLVFLAASSLFRRRFLLPSRPVGEATRRAWILAVPAFTLLGWAGLGWSIWHSLADPTLWFAVAFVLYAHGARLAVQTGHGVRVLGAWSVGLGSVVLAGAAASFFWSPAAAIGEILDGFTFPGARLCMGLYGGILAWNGYWLLRARQDKA